MPAATPIDSSQSTSPKRHTTDKKCFADGEKEKAIGHPTTDSFTDPIMNGSEIKTEGKGKAPRVAFSSDTKHQDAATTLAKPKKKGATPDSAKAKAKRAKQNAEKIEKARQDAADEQRRQRAIAEASRRRDIETTVFQIQEMLLEQKVTPLQLIQSTDFLTPAEYADVVTERSLSLVCGYPLCWNKLEKLSIREKGGKFKISMKDHRVYDMEQIRQFCHNDCHVSSDFFSSQLLPMVAHMRTGKEVVKEKIQLLMREPELKALSANGSFDTVAPLIGSSGAALVRLSDLKQLVKPKSETARTTAQQPAYTPTQAKQQNNSTSATITRQLPSPNQPPTQPASQTLPSESQLQPRPHTQETSQRTHTTDTTTSGSVPVLQVGDGIVAGSSAADGEYSAELERMLENMNVREIYDDAQATPMPSTHYNTDTYAVDGFLPAPSKAKGVQGLLATQAERSDDRQDGKAADGEPLVETDVADETLVGDDYDAMAFPMQGGEDELDTPDTERKSVQFDPSVKAAPAKQMRKHNTKLKATLSLFQRAWMMLMDWNNAELRKYLQGVIDDSAGGYKEVDEDTFDPMTDDWEAMKATATKKTTPEKEEADRNYRTENYDPVATRHAIIQRQLGVVFKAILSGKGIRGCTYANIRKDLGSITKRFTVTRSRCVYLTSPLDQLIALVLIESMALRNPFVASACSGPSGSPFAAMAQTLFQIDRDRFEDLVAILLPET